VGGLDRLHGRAVDLEEILKRVTESYRRIRNTLRFLLANTSDFDPAQACGAGRRTARNRPLRDRRMAELQKDIAAHYERYEFHPVVSRLQNYCSEDLGGFYLDILKDRLYTTGVDSQGTPLGADRALAHHPLAAARDGADPVLHRRGSLGRVRGPASLCGFSDETIFTQTLWTFPEVPTRRAAGQVRRLREVRADVTKQLEEVRASGAIGSSLQAELTIKAAGDKARAAGEPGRRPEVRLHHLAGEVEQAANEARKRCRSRHRKRRSASAAGTTAATSATTTSTGPVRPLREQPVRQGRSTPLRVSAGVARNLADRHAATCGMAVFLI
jgi:isoleucyl-tRNA synthetase